MPNSLAAWTDRDAQARTAARHLGRADGQETQCESRDEVQQAQVHSMEMQMGVKSRRTVMEERGIENIKEEERRLGIDFLVAQAEEQMALEAEAEAEAANEE